MMSGNRPCYQFDVGLGLGEASHSVAAAFIGSCNTTRLLCEKLVDQPVLTLPGETQARDTLMRRLLSDSSIDPFRGS